MTNIGRNDPCPCGSGKKYKKCCLNNSEVDPFNEAAIAAELPAVIAEHDWYNDKYEAVATTFYSMNKGNYPPSFIGFGIGLWMIYCDRAVPVVHKETVSAAALEYLLFDLFELDVTQTELAKKYGVSAGSISNRYRDMEFELLDILDEMELQAEAERATAASFNSRMLNERLMADLEHALSEREFESEEELQQFLDTFNAGEQNIPKPQSNKARAQDLLYDAWDSPSHAERVRLAMRALELHADSPDAYVILAQEVADDVKEMREYFYKGMKAGERDLGPEFFEENEGHFWGIIETRPYMRAKQGYAECCWEMGDYEEALGHYREMLRLNPGDNQGIRYDLLRGLLELRQYEEAEQLLDKYPEDFGNMAYNCVLIAYAKNGLTKQVDELLEEALAANPHVPAYLLGIKPLPEERPEYIGLGDEREAIDYAFDHMALWWREKELLKRLNQLFKKSEKQ